MFDFKNPQISVIFKNINSLIFLQIFIAGVGFLTTAQIGKILGPDVFGHLSYALSIGAYGSIIMQFGIDKTLTRDVIHNPINAKQILITSIIIKLLFFILVVLIIIIFSSYIFSKDHIYSSYFIVLSLLVGSFGIGHFYDAKKITYIHSFFTFFHRGAYFIILWSLFFLSINSISILIIGIVMSLTALFGLILEYIYLRNYIFNKVSDLMIKIKKLLINNFRIWMTEIIGLSLVYLNKIILMFFAGASELGQFQVSWVIITLATLFMSQIIRVGNVYFSENTKVNVSSKRRKLFLLNYLLLMTIIGIVFYTFFYFFNDILVIYFFGDAYAEASKILRIAALYIILFGSYTVSLQYLININQTKIYSFFIIFISIISILLNFIFISQSGNIGAAWALPLSVLIGIPFLIFVIFKVEVLEKLENKL
tara:strand:- start:672 stop:1943 length:1272 start_codon:yes stop_codon:yes gene_type:complete